MLQILEIILVFFESFNSTDTTESVIDVVSENNFLASSPIGDEAKQNFPNTNNNNPTESDSEACKRLTEKVQEAHNKQSAFHPVSILTEVSEDGRKRVAIAAGGDYIGIGNKTVNGYVSFPAPKEEK